MVVTNTFTGGINTDAYVAHSPMDSYSLALNAIDQTKEHKLRGLTNEMGNILAYSFTGEIKGYSYIEDIDHSLFFIWNGQSEIHLYNHATQAAERVATDAEFGCDWGFDGCEFLYAEFKRFNACNELHAYWHSDRDWETTCS